jgi:hypothetical protein
MNWSYRNSLRGIDTFSRIVGVSNPFNTALINSLNQIVASYAISKPQKLQGFDKAVFGAVSG